MQPIVIKQSKKGTLSVLLIFVIVLLISLWGLIYMDNTVIAFLWIIHVKFTYICIIDSVIMFVLICIYGYRLLNPKAALTITDEGIRRKNGTSRAHYIEWKDISDIGIVKYLNQTFITVQVVNEDDYVFGEPSALTHSLLKFSLRFFGAPFVIGANMLDINTDELHRLLLRKLNEYQAKP